METTDVLVITYNRAAYTQMVLKRLLATCDDSTRIWIWHNGTDEETLAISRSFALDPKVTNFHHSVENKRLWEPTTWLWKNSKADYLGKVDDDCLVPDSWTQRLQQAHQDVPEFGIIGCWHFPEDNSGSTPEMAPNKIQQFHQHRLLRNMWVGGSGYLIKRACLNHIGLLHDGESFTNWCIRAARSGWVNGWIYPFLYQDHMDDPRALHSGLKTEKQFLENRPLTAINLGIETVAAWEAHLKEDARRIFLAPVNPSYWSPWRMKFRRIKSRIFDYRR